MSVYQFIEYLNLIKQFLSRVFPDIVGPSSNTLPFEQLEEALGYRIVVAISATAHAVGEVVRPQECLPVLALENCPDPS